MFIIGREIDVSPECLIGVVCCVIPWIETNNALNTSQHQTVAACDLCSLHIYVPLELTSYIETPTFIDDCRIEPWLKAD